MLDVAAYRVLPRAARDLALSALPDAPVVALETLVRPPLRRQAAVVLHRLADRLQTA
jgi:hypothetical protein